MPCREEQANSSKGSALHDVKYLACGSTHLGTQV